MKPKPPVRPKLPRHEFIEEISAALVPVTTALKQIERLERFNDELVRQVRKINRRIDAWERLRGPAVARPAASLSRFDHLRGLELDAKQ